MMFTISTIVFVSHAQFACFRSVTLTTAFIKRKLPLSFLSSFFALDIESFQLVPGWVFVVICKFLQASGSYADILCLIVLSSRRLLDFHGLAHSSCSLLELNMDFGKNVLG